MKHNITHRKLNRTSSHRKALLMNLSNALIKHEQITTTLAKTVKAESINHKIVVVLSAMAGVTNKMQEHINNIKSDEKIENDMILTSGENVTIGILSALLKNSKLTKAMKGYFAKKNTEAKKKLKEYRVANTENYKEGNEFGLEIFKDIKFVDTKSKTIGKGFAGAMKIMKNSW